MNTDTLLLGQTLSFDSDPFGTDPEDAANLNTHGAVLIRGERIHEVGQAMDLKTRYPEARQIDYGTKLLMAGFVDAHAHYPQTAIIASWGKRLIDWLNSYTFPEEARFNEPAYAAKIANRYLDLTTGHGTTTVCSYCTIHPTSVDALFEAAQARGQRIIAGKTCMDRNAPDNLRDTAQSAYDDSKALLAKWNKVDRLNYAITPRFSPTSSPDQLSALGALWAEHPEVVMQTHLSEQTDEIEWVKSLYPKARDYLDTYEQHGLLGKNAIYGHAIHLEQREQDRLREVGAALVHCPTSNTFIGSGLFNLAGLKKQGQRIGLATDTGGGSSFSMLRTMASAYEISQLKGIPLHAAQLIWLATVGSADSLNLNDKVGNLTAGHEADIVALDLGSTPAIAQRTAQANSLWEALFATIMMGDDRAIHDVWIGGQQAKPIG